MGPLVLEPSADGGALKTGRKGTGRFDVTIRGRAAHAGLEPEKGLNSILEAAAQLLQIATFADPELGTTVTPTLITGGTADNVVPAVTELKVDVRVAAAGEKERLERLMAGLTPTIEGTDHRARRRHRTTADARECVDDADAGRAAAWRTSWDWVPSTASPWVAAATGTSPPPSACRTLDGLGAVGGGAHADHEFVVVDTIPDRAALLAASWRRSHDHAGRTPRRAGGRTAPRAAHAAVPLAAAGGRGGGRRGVGEAREHTRRRAPSRCGAGWSTSTDCGASAPTSRG